MLRKKSRASSKQALMADYGSPSIFNSARLFTGIASKGFTDNESVLSPTSILDSKPFSGLRNPFWSTDSQATKSPKPENRIHWDKLDSRGVGLGIVDALRDDEKSDPKQSKPISRMVLFGSQLKIQIPPPPHPHSVPSPAESLNSPADFGIKTRNSRVGSFSPGLILSPGKKSPFGPATSGLENLNSPSVFTGSLSASEMELSEDYTRVISRGPNPRTTHIFDDCIVESCCGVVGISAVGKENGFSCSRSMSYPSESFLSFCYACKKNLGLGKDIYMYRGEKAFCSSECRSKEMMLEEGKGKIEFNQDAYGACP